MKLLSLTPEMITDSQPIAAWLNQFPVERRLTASGMLQRLRFVSRDMYSEWLKTELTQRSSAATAIYAVRQTDHSVGCLWDDAGNVIERPAKSLGSEDLVQSVVAQLAKAAPGRFLDNPSLTDLRRRQPTDVLLLDDSIGSGKRVAGFIQLMMNSPTFLSWWSYGKIRIQVLAFSRMIDADETVRQAARGSDHPKRTYPKSTKIAIASYLATNRIDIERRWGRNHYAVMDLCACISDIPRNRHRGYGNTMANVVFYHSVPNNLPGILWFKRGSFEPLFPRRSVPAWLPNLLAQSAPKVSRTGIGVNDILLLRAVKRGIRRNSSLARQLGVDTSIISPMISSLRERGLLTAGNRITEAGVSVLRRQSPNIPQRQFDRSLYVPTSWCAGPLDTTQPLG